MAENRYWFARRYPVGHPRNSMAPVSEEGFRVVRTFIACMVGGAVAALVLIVGGVWFWPFFILAPIVFAGLAGLGGWHFISQAQGRGDHAHTVADYKAGKIPGHAA